MKIMFLCKKIVHGAVTKKKSQKNLNFIDAKKRFEFKFYAKPNLDISQKPMKRLHYNKK